MNTVNAAKSIRRSDQYGGLSIGRSADVSVLRIEEGPVKLFEGHESIKAARRLRGGVWHDAAHDLKSVPGRYRRRYEQGS